MLDKTLVLSIICNKYGNKDEKWFKQEEQIEIFTILGLIKIQKSTKWIYDYFIDKYGWRKQSIIWIEKYRWNKELFHWRNTPKWIDE